MLAIIPFSAGAALFDHWNSGTSREFFHSRWEIDMLVIHDKTEDAPARATTKTVKGLPARTYREGWRFLLMKRTKRLEIRSRAFQRKVRTNHLHDVVGGGDLLDVL